MMEVLETLNMLFHKCLGCLTRPSSKVGDSKMTMLSDPRTVFLNSGVTRDAQSLNVANLIPKRKSSKK